jgi:hypothetical protein
MKLGMRLEGFHAPSDGGLIVSLFERGRYDSKLSKFTPFRPEGWEREQKPPNDDES